MAIFLLTPKQCLKTKSPIININNCLNKFFKFFLALNSLNRELSPGFYSVNTFSNCFSFHSVNRKDIKAKTTNGNKLNNIYKDSIINQNTILIIPNVSVKNNIITLVLHIQRGHEIIAKNIHYIMNVSSTKAKLFTIKYSISQATQIQNVTHIVIITNAIQVVK